MMIIKLPHKKTDFGNWYSNLLIFVIGPIKTIVKNAICPFCPLRITSSPPIRYISNRKFAPKFDLVFTFHWGFLLTYLLIIISGTHLLTIFWALQFTPSSCCDDTNFGKKWKHNGSHNICSKYYIGVDYEDQIYTEPKPITDKTFDQKQ